LINARLTESVALRVIICWTEISGYIAACWRELAARPEIDLLILAWHSNFSRSETKFQRTLMDGLPVRFLEEHEQQDAELVAQLVATHKPDILLMGGWAEKPYRQLVWNKTIPNCRLVLAMDSPWRGTFRQRFARLKIGRYIDRLDAIFVPGQRGVVYARHLAMSDDRIFTGMLGFDYRLFEPTLDRRAANPWPKRFIFLGRYSIPKGLDLLAAGYSNYRKSVPDPWPLACFGSGPMRYQLEHCEGIEINDWVQPADQPEVLLRHGVSLLTSRTEAWAIAVAEAMASGLPVICTDAVGAVPDLIRPEINGLVVPSNDLAAIASAMKWMHDHYDNLPAMGQAAKQAAAPYSAQNWVKQFETMAQKLCNMPVRR
jgi:glycosyltransferase involved in cell wall biosynthesis